MPDMELGANRRPQPAREPPPTMRYAITDETWAVMGPMVERCKSRLGPALSCPTGCSLRPSSTGPAPASPGVTCSRTSAIGRPSKNRLRRWVASGRLKRLFGEMFLGLVRLVFGFIHIRKAALSVNTPQPCQERPHRSVLRVLCMQFIMLIKKFLPRRFGLPRLIVRLGACEPTCVG